MFNPHDVQDIRRVMEKALTDEAFYRELKAHALTQSAKFSGPIPPIWRSMVSLVCCSRPKGTCRAGGRRDRLADSDDAEN